MASLKCASASLVLNRRVPRLLWETACSGHRLCVCVCVCVGGGGCGCGCGWLGYESRKQHLVPVSVTNRIIVHLSWMWSIPNIHSLVL